MRLPMTRREYFAECTKYQFLKLIRETSQTDLDRSTQSTIFQFSSYFKYSLINGYTTMCNVTNCYVCGWLLPVGNLYLLFVLFFVISSLHYYCLVLSISLIHDFNLLNLSTLIYAVCHIIISFITLILCNRSPLRPAPPSPHPFQNIIS